ncbi:MAG: porin family protein [Segetibacter sp.]
MKNVLLALILSSGFSLAAGAQSKFSLGPNAGVGASWLDNTPNRKAKLSGNPGLSLVYSAAQHFGIGLDARYSFEGGKYSSASQAVTSDLNYFRLPLKFIYFFGDYGNRVRPKVYAGPSFGFLTGGKTTIELPNNTKVESNSKDIYKSFDLGLTAGAGLNIRLVKNTWFNTDVHYLHGISDLTAGKQHNRGVGVNVGVNFGL